MTTATPTAGSDEAFLEDLRALEASAVRERGWHWLCAIDAKRDPDRLAALFRLGYEPTTPDGACEGRVLGLFGTPFMGFVDTLVRAGRMLGGIGWTGKTFDAESGRGFNRLTTTSRGPMFLAMPRYRFGRHDGQLTGFGFHHAVEPSERDPELTVVAIKYDDPADANPLMLPRTRDELVELAPGLYLGRALLRPDGSSDQWQVVAYFALRPPVGA